MTPEERKKRLREINDSIKNLQNALELLNPDFKFKQEEKNGKNVCVGSD